jgi:diguanylate cyclase (GGDEF)-like protein/PAS domain S-box-containing protein
VHSRLHHRSLSPQGRRSPSYPHLILGRFERGATSAPAASPSARARGALCNISDRSASSAPPAQTPPEADTAIGLFGAAGRGPKVRRSASRAQREAAPAVDYQSFVAGWGDLNTVATLDGVYRYISPVSQRLFGWDPSELEGRSQDDFVHPDDVASFRARRGDLAPGQVATVTYRFRCGDGSYRWTETTFRRVEAKGEVLVVSAVRDIGDRRTAMVALQHQACTDPLTGVANRTVLMDRLRQGLRRLDRASGVLAVLYIDLDRFKVLNDSLGHHVGDSVLLKMAERLTHHLRPADTVARLGGDEFVILAEGVADEQSAIELANRIIQAGRETYRLGDEAFTCTLSVGIACTADSQRAAEELLQEADLALYRAKDRGRDRAEVFDDELRTRAVGRLVTERMLRRALDEQRLVVEYQPVVDLRSGHAVGAEALVRIRDPEGGLLRPESFLEVAEETGLLIAMDEQVLVDAVKEARGWHTRLAGTEFAEIAINVTARHLADVGFPDAVIGHLDANSVPHHNLQIEVTERVLMEASNSAMTGLRALRGEGVQVGLDDFGTGYTSLAYLRHFPLDFVKIDKSVIEHLDRDKAEQAIVAGIIELAHALELTVVAEGVEAEPHLRALEELHCDRAQGFLFAAPAEPDVVDAFVTAGPAPPLRPTTRG